MRNIWTIARKELRSYFDHPTAYILIVVFLAINFFFYFRSAFLVGEASLRPMFDLLPWIFLFFVPAVTMGALAEEKRQGTLEVVLSHPLREHEFLLGKYLGNFLFLAIALGATLMAPLTLTLAGTPDFGVVVAQYIGGLLLAGAMAAIGMFASALTRNQITAFIVGTATIFVFVLVGVEVVQIGLPSWLSDPVAQLGILTHFQNVTRGVLDLRDLVYFVTLGAAFLALAYWLLLRDRLNRSAPLYRNLRLGTAAILAIAVVANLFGAYIPGRVDLTAENLYTLSDGTKQILRGLDDVVTITLYASDELPTQVQTLERDVRDVLRDFRRFSDGNVQVIRKHPDQSEEARQEAQRVGVQPVQFNVVRREELQLKQGWLGLAVRYADETESIPFVGEVRNLEYQLASFVWKLTRTETPKIAFVSGQGGRAAGEYGAFRRELEDSYEVTTIDLTPPADTLEPAEAEPIGADVAAVIVPGPRRAAAPQARRALREYLANDGRVLYLGEGVDVNLQVLFASAAPDSVRNFVEELGVQLRGDLVFDLRSNEAISMPGQFINYVVSYPFWVRALPASDHTITRDLNSVFLPWPSSLDTVPIAGRRFTPLLETSEFAGRQTQGFQIRPDQELAYSQEDLGYRLLAVAVEGAVVPGPAPARKAMLTDTVVVGQADGGAEAERDAAAGTGGSTPPESANADSGPEASTEDPQMQEGAADGTQPEGMPRGRAVVVGDADFLADRFARNSPENLIFGLNAVDWLTQTEALTGIRAKTPTPRPLVPASELEKQVIKYLNLIGVPLAFVIFGTVRLLGRRRKTRKEYEPPTTGSKRSTRQP